ncbi:MAG: ubiquitin carboxyl-terminal hydrolase, partial [Cyanobium sp.]
MRPRRSRTPAPSSRWPPATWPGRAGAAAAAASASPYDSKINFPIVNFDPNNNLDNDSGHPMYHLIGGIFHQPTTTDRGHYIAVCNINHDRHKWITYDDEDFEKTKFINSRERTPTAMVKFQKGAYMLFYQRIENVSSTSDSESNHDGSESD